MVNLTSAVSTCSEMPGVGSMHENPFPLLQFEMRPRRNAGWKCGVRTNERKTPSHLTQWLENSLIDQVGLCEADPVRMKHGVTARTNRRTWLFLEFPGASYWIDAGCTRQQAYYSYHILQSPISWSTRLKA